ncbi:hypothetical protein B0E53_03877 [Micromonospora sp. MH33]|nr:hypothetical protein B0E53_03877 [Micromonospora sp. MH33]
MMPATRALRSKTGRLSSSPCRGPTTRRSTTAHDRDQPRHRIPHRRDRQRVVRHPRDHLLHRPAGSPGRRLRHRPARRDGRPLRHHRRQAAPGAVRLLPADRRRRGADVRRGPDPRLVLPPRGPAQRGRHPHLPADRPAAAPVVRQGPAQRGPGRRDRAGARPAAPVRRGGHQRRLDVDQALRPAVLRPDRRDPGRARRRPVGRLPDPGGAGPGHLRHGRGRPGTGRRRRRDHDGRGRGDAARRGPDLGRRHRPDRGDRGQRPGGRQAGDPRAVPRAERAGRGGRQAGRRVPGLPGLPGRRLRGGGRGGPRRGGRGPQDRRQGGPRGGSGPGQGQGRRGARRSVRGPREGALRRLPVADQVRGPQPGAARAGPHRRPRPARHPPADRRGRRAAAGARLGAVRAGRDPDPGRHHAEHAAHGADGGHAVPGEPQALHAQLQLPAVLDR